MLGVTRYRAGDAWWTRLRSSACRWSPDSDAGGADPSTSRSAGTASSTCWRFAQNGLLSGDPTGALIRVNRNGTRDVVMSDGLTMPGGLALRHHAAYVSNCGVCPGVGSVLHIGLR